jgi:hypothetical protein
LIDVSTTHYKGTRVVSLYVCKTKKKLGKYLLFFTQFTTAILILNKKDDSTTVSVN